MPDYKSSRTEIRHADVLKYEGVFMNDSEIADIYRISKMAFSKIRKQMGWVRTTKGVRRDKGVPRKEMAEKRENYNRYMRKYRRDNGIKHPATRIGDKFVGTSRLVAEKRILGRDLLEGEVVHHRDKDTENNDPGNLMVFESQGDHLAYHRGDKGIKKIEYLGSDCFRCGLEVTHDNKGVYAMDKYMCGDCIWEMEEVELLKEKGIKF